MQGMGMTENMTLGERITHARTRIGMTQDELAKRVGYRSQSSIGSLESGARRKTTRIAELADALQVESLWLSSGIGPMVTGEDALSETAMRIAEIVNKMPGEQQRALLHLITGQAALTAQQPAQQNQ